MTVINLLIQVLSGALGGNLSGQAFRDFSLGRIGDAFAGIIGGVLAGRILQSVLGPTLGPSVDDPPNIFISLAGGCVGGAIFAALLGWIGSTIKTD